MRGRENRDNNQHEHLLIGFIPFLLPHLLCLSAKPVLTQACTHSCSTCVTRRTRSLSRVAESVLYQIINVNLNRKFSVSQQKFTYPDKPFFIHWKGKGSKLYPVPRIAYKFEIHQHPFESVLVSVHQLRARRKKGAKCLRGRPRRR